MNLKDLVMGTTQGTTSQPQQAPQAPQAPKPSVEKAPIVEEPPKVEPKKKKKVEAPKVEAPKPKSAKKDLFVSSLSRHLKPVELWFGDPGTGKTTLARSIFQNLKESGELEDYVVVNAQEELTVMSIFKTTRTDEDGNWKFIHNAFFKMLTDKAQSRYGVIIDEFNTMPMSVMKSLQPIIDDTEGDFVFEEQTYTKNPNVYFIFTMNHNDMGVSQLPVAIKDRVFPKFFDALSDEVLAQRSGVTKELIDKLRRVRQMFSHLGDLPEFHKSVRQLKSLQGADGATVKEYIVAQLALAQIKYEEAIAISPEFHDLIKEFDDVKGGE